METCYRESTVVECHCTDPTKKDEDVVEEVKQTLTRNLDTLNNLLDEMQGLINKISRASHTIESTFRIVARSTTDAATAERVNVLNAESSSSSIPLSPSSDESKGTVDDMMFGPYENKTVLKWKCSRHHGRNHRCRNCYYEE